MICCGKKNKILLAFSEIIEYRSREISETVTEYQREEQGRSNRSWSVFLFNLSV